MELRELYEKISLQTEMIRKLETVKRETDLAQAEPLLEQLMDIKTAAAAYSRLQELLGEDPGSIKMLLCQMKCAARIHESYRKKGIPDEIYVDTMKCFPRFIGECGRRNGEQFFDRGWWTYRQIGMRLFRIGALEYELQGNEQEKKIDIHIPSDADFSASSVEVSLGRAKQFFADFYPDYGEAVYTCDSWLLSPALETLLPENSHILSFQRRFVLTGIRQEQEDCLEWLFSVPDGTDYEKLPENTLLQRNTKRLLLEGGAVGCARGILR